MAKHQPQCVVAIKGEMRQRGVTSHAAGEDLRDVRRGLLEASVGPHAKADGA